MLYIPRSDSGVNALMKWMAIEEEAAQRRQATKQWRVEMARQAGDYKTAQKLLGDQVRFANPLTSYAEQQKANLQGQIKDVKYESPVQEFLGKIDPGKAGETIQVAGDHENRIFLDRLNSMGIDKTPTWKDYNAARSEQITADSSPAMMMLASLTPEEFGKAQSILSMKDKYKAQAEKITGSAELQNIESAMGAGGQKAPTWTDYQLAQAKKAEIEAQEQKNKQIRGEISRLEKISGDKYLRGTAGEMQDTIIRDTMTALRGARDKNEAAKIWLEAKNSYNDVGQFFYRKDGQAFPSLNDMWEETRGSGVGGRPDKYIIEFKDGTTETVFATVPSETSLPRFFDDNRKRLKMVSNKPIKDAYPASGVNASSLQEGRRKDYERLREDEFVAKREREKVQEEYNSAWGDRWKRKVMQKYPNYYADDSGVIRPRSSTNVAGGDKEDEYDQ